MSNHNILAEELIIGEGTFIEPTAIIRGVNGKAKRIVIGDHCYIGKNVQIICDDFSLGDYSKIHHDTNVHGYKPCRIGHNAWIGQFCIIDSIGGTTIGDNCGIGAHSQLWSHIKYGDTLEGCRFISEKALDVGKDVWFVGHCIVSPIRANDKSMAMVGSVITKDMEKNMIYAGSPAKEITSKIGGQFKDVTTQEKLDKMVNYLNLSGSDPEQIKIVATKADIIENGLSYFAVAERVYSKTLHPEEVKFMKYLLPEKGKFTPVV
jgi:acetyltransferase-like isoleucine patch superfamily enzyme